MNKLATSLFLLILLPSASMAKDDVYANIKNKLSYLNQRQSLLSANISNSDTPGYKASDLAPQNTRKSGIKMATTSPMHISGSKAGGNFKTIKPDTYETSMDGNNVDLQEQMVKMSETDLEYRATVSVMKQMDGLMRAAIGENR